MSSKTKSGTAGEDFAVNYLRNKGYRILDRNFRFEHGEIDIIAEDKSVLVFVEVKTSHSKGFGEPEDAVTDRKCELIRSTADGYLFKHDIDERACRFDIVAIDFCGRTPIVRHIEDAF